MREQTQAMLEQAITCSAQGSSAEALELFRRVLAVEPDNFDALHGIGIVCGQCGEFGPAAEYFARAAQRQPDNFLAHYNHGKALEESARYDAALTAYDRALSLAPDLPEAHFNRALVLQRLGRPHEALPAYDRAIALRPGYADAYVNRGAALAELGRWDEAVASCDTAISFRPDHGEAYYNRGVILQDLERYPEALANYDKVVRLLPRYTDAHYNRGIILVIQGRVDEAVQSLERAVSIRPDYALAHMELGHARMYRGDLACARQNLQQAIELEPDLVQAHHNRLFMMNYQPLVPAQVGAAHRDFADRFEAPLLSSWGPPSNGRDPGRRLKVGYVSPDLRQHSVAYFLEPVLAHHDKTRVEVYCYYNRIVEDTVTARLRPLADHWIACKSLTDEQLAARIRSDGIDILIDLAGHTAGNRLLVFARKPAPVQVSYLGYPATTGLQAMDWRLVTAETDPAGAEQWHSERLYRLPRSLWCYRPPGQAGEVKSETPARQAGHVTFGSMNNIAKVSEAAIATWSGILKRVSGSRLVMTGLADGARQRIREQFESQGIGEERLQLHGRLGTEAFHGVLGTIDLALDTFPYAGTTTTCEVLWLGIPVITLEGETSVARSGQALLKLLGLEELIARSEAEYIEKAVELANDLNRLDALHRGLRARFESSPLRDEAGYTRELEAAYRAMWTDWCGRGAER
jgi:predicted O-linked N-acetylglucosamine transferase (SPINDLY family)